MTSIHSLWALASHLGINPTELITKAGEKLVVDGSSKAVSAAGRYLVGSVKGVFFRFSKQISDSFPEYLRKQIDETDHEQRSRIIEAAFAEWVKTHTSEAAELERLLFRIVYLRALVNYCSNLPVVSGLENQLYLEDVWVPQTFRIAQSVLPGKHPSGDLKFETLSQALMSCASPAVLIGVSGAGKTTQLRKLILNQARWQLETVDFDQLLTESLPIYINAKALVKERADLITALTHAIPIEMGLHLPFSAPIGFYDPRQPGAPRSFIIVIDGLDEIPPEKRDQLIQEIKSHGESFRIVIASQTALNYSGIAQIDLEEPSLEQADVLIRKLIPKNSVPQQIGSGLPRNPLLLTLTALLKRQKISSRAMLYQEFIVDRLMRSHEPQLREAKVGFELLQVTAQLDSDIADQADRLMTELKLLPDGLHGLSRQRNARALLVSTGIVRQDGERLSFIHESFRSYLRSETLARAQKPQAAPWRAISPFREGWETVAFIVEIWQRDGQDITPALEDLLLFGEPGLQLIAQIANRNADLSPPLIDRAVGKWMHKGKDAYSWEAGLINGPIEQLTLMAVHYEAARNALRTIAQDEWNYSDDAAYAAQGLAEAGFEEEARAFLIALNRNDNAYCGSRVLAVELLIEIGAVTEARDCAEALSKEWADDSPDESLSWMGLAKALHKLDRKREANNILIRLEEELEGELELSFLAETYLAIKKPRKAKAVALRAFHTEEWLCKEYSDYKATEMANLLDSVGAIDEAALIRSHHRVFEAKESEGLRAIAADVRQSAKHRLESAVELFERDDPFGLEALTLLLTDNRLPAHERFHTTSQLLESPQREATVSTLKQIAKDEPWYGVECGKALILSGEPEEGCRILTRVAFEPAEAVRDRAVAIELLAQSGRTDLAIAAFRRFKRSGDLEPYWLDQLTSTFAHTVVWKEVLDDCIDLLSSDDPALRVEALRILVRANRIEGQSQYAWNFLRHILCDRELELDLRMQAAGLLIEIEKEMAQDLLFDIATSQEETLEAGIEAMRRLYYLDEFLAIDGGLDVVWDVKLSVDQFIEAAHAFLDKERYRDSSSDVLISECLVNEIPATLLKIATDTSQPIERRFAAARVKNPRDAHSFEHPFWPGVDAICQDEAVPIQVRAHVIRYALHKDSSRIEQWRSLLDSDEFSHLEKAYCYLASGCVVEATENFRLSLVHESDLRTRVRILKALEPVDKEAFVGREAAKALSEAIDSHSVESFEPELLVELLMLSKSVLSIDQFVGLAKLVANHQGLDVFDIGPAVNALAEHGATTDVSAILETRKTTAKSLLRRDLSAVYELIHLLYLQSQLIDRDGAINALNDICSKSGLDISLRSSACRTLARIGKAADARSHLRRDLAKASNLSERLCIAQTCLDIHDWSLARSTFLSAAKDPLLSPRQRVDCAAGLAKVGFKESAIQLLSTINLTANNFIYQNGIKVLADCDQAERAVAICRSYLKRDDVCSLDKIDVLSQISSRPRKERARNLLVWLVSKEECDIEARARGAELLHSMGYDADARSILFHLVDQPICEVYDALEIADALVFCSLPFTAQKVLGLINLDVLNSDEKQRFTHIKYTLHDLQF